MTDLRSTADSGDRAQNPNPPVPNDTSSPIQTLHESHHNPENQGALKMVSDLLLHPESDGTILISQEKAEILRLLIGVEHLINTHTLTVMQKITSLLDSIETSIVNKVVEPLPAKSPMTSWATITKKNRVQTNPQSTIRSPPPTRTMKKVNHVLTDLEAKLEDSTRVTIKGVVHLVSGDIRFYTQTRFATDWLLKHKHKWTHLCDASLVTPQMEFEVILNTVPLNSPSPAKKP
ncbi:hypothetical protein PSTG_02009 [Puccinia striiformis f. sp. tritici PST-78]|uniref:Uncharacterized protein n=1 Tax=Puccinia striiformis f. sp. tritici PST-78 TaxID=1165861 RepID=A0A0L0W0C9_9BASI|nr:hypothetical protein PSTG_02009 [Puccinia striiformis f. sp. tritici PST-78]